MNKVTIKIKGNLFLVRINGKEIIYFGKINIFAGNDCESANYSELREAFEIYSTVNYVRMRINDLKIKL